MLGQKIKNVEIALEDLGEGVKACLNSKENSDGFLTAKYSECLAFLDLKVSELEKLFE